MAKENKVKTEEKNANTLELKSVLLSKQKELEDRNDVLLKEMQERNYELSFENKKIFNQLMKYLEHKADWKHTTASGLVMLYNNLRESKLLVQSKDWDNTIKLRAANIATLYNMMLNMSGKGYFEAADFIGLMASIGESLSNSYNKFNEDNQALRDAHTDLAQIDQLLDEGKYQDDMKEDESKSKPELESVEESK